jgi:hypothetical protein
MVVKRPEGHKIIDQAIAAVISGYSNDALVTFPSHGLSTGDFVYITSDIDEYNGFWYVTIVNGNTFKISEYEGADFVEYYQDADIEYYQTQSHVWNSIFLPIVYKVSNTKWPLNTTNATGLILLNSDDNGFTEITLAAPLSGLFAPLQFVKISGGLDTANGVWQVTEIINNVQFVIDLPFENSGSLIAKSVQIYYNSYQTKVRVYAGLDVTHPWSEKKPYELVGELSLTPDENNITTFSISDYLKGKIQIKNNTLLYSLPLNLDAFTGFYIETAESFDSSDNYTIFTDESDFEADDFEGYAIAGKLPFKNTYSGDYSDYVATDGNPALWLSTLGRLLAVSDRFFDLSFINPVDADFQIILKKYFTADYYITETVDYESQGIGVYRIGIIPDSQYIKYCLQATTNGSPTPPSPPTLQALASWTNGPGSLPWSLGANPATSVNGNGGLTNYIVGTFAGADGVDHKFTIDIDLTPGSMNFTVRAALLDGSYNVLDSIDFIYTTSGNKIETDFVLNPSTDSVYFGITCINNTVVSTKSIDINSASFNGFVSGGGSGVDPMTLTDEICFDVIDDCEVTEGFIPDDIRLTEDGDYRILE